MFHGLSKRNALNNERASGLGFRVQCVGGGGGLGYTQKPLMYIVSLGVESYPKPSPENITSPEGIKVEALRMLA